MSVKIGRFGPLVQIGNVNDDEKPQFASLLKGQSMADITLEEALKLFEFPRQLGTYEDKEVSVAIGRFGPYVRHDGVFVSIPKDIQPAAVTLDEAIELIEEKRRSKAQRLIKSFAENADIQVLNGRYGAYIAYNGKNYKIPKTIGEPADISYQQAMELIKEQDEKPSRPATTRRRKTAK